MLNISKLLRCIYKAFINAWMKHLEIPANAQLIKISLWKNPVDSICRPQSDFTYRESRHITASLWSSTQAIWQLHLYQNKLVAVNNCVWKNTATALAQSQCWRRGPKISVRFKWNRFFKVASDHIRQSLSTYSEWPHLKKWKAYRHVVICNVLYKWG